MSKYNISRKIIMCSDDGGYALIMSLIIIAVLMIGGVLVSNTTITDLTVAKNSSTYSQNLVAAESAVMTAIQALEQITEPKKLNVEKYSCNQETKWINGKDNTELKLGALTTLDITSKRGETDALKYYVIGWEPAVGASLGKYNVSSLKECRVIGLYKSPKSGQTIVEMGYKKRF